MGIFYNSNYLVTGLLLPGNADIVRKAYSLSGIVKKIVVRYPHAT